MYMVDTKNNHYRLSDDVNAISQMREQDESALMHSENDVVQVVHQLNEAGYEPYKLLILCVSVISRKPKNTISNILHHRVIPRMGLMKWIDEETYNNIVSAVFKFQNDVFKQTIDPQVEHKIGR